MFETGKNEAENIEIEIEELRQKSLLKHEEYFEMLKIYSETMKQFTGKEPLLPIEKKIMEDCKGKLIAKIDNYYDAKYDYCIKLAIREGCLEEYEREMNAECEENLKLFP